MTYRTPLILFLGLATLWGVERYKEERVLAEKIEITPTSTAAPTSEPTPIPTVTPQPTNTPTPKPTPVPSPTPVPQPKFSSEQIYEFTNRFGGQYGVDPNVLRHIAICESGFRPDAKNHIYAGLYQFDTRTWKTYRQKMGEATDPDLRYNAEEAVQTTAYALSLGMKRLWPNCAP